MMKQNKIKYIKKLEKMQLRLDKSISPSLIKLLTAILNDIKSIKITSSIERKQLKELYKKIDNITIKRFRQYEQSIINDITDFTLKESKVYNEALAVYLSAPIFHKPTKEMKEIIANSFTLKRVQFKEKSINQMFKALAKSSANSAKSKVLQLYLDDVNPQSITAEVAKLFKLKGKTNKQVRARAKSFYHTSLSIAREDAREALEKDYAKYIGGWLFDAHMDSRTTPYCRDHEETFYPKSKYPTRESLRAKGVYVPAHFNCRSMIIPINK